jgi:hypothetical protein|tara:strand:+ start:541 stop:1164 length:624 start_codon:yes stop_codon:yes gene_type:complete
MASVNSPRGLVLAKKNGDGSNSTGIRTIDMNNASPKVASALIPSDMFTGDPIIIEAQGSIKPCADGVSVKSSGVFQGCSFVNGSGEQKFAKSIVGGVTATDVKIHIASDPDQTFFIQADATVTASAGFGVGVVNGPYIAGTGSHRTGNSGYTLDASGPVITTNNLRVIRRAPWDTGGVSAGVSDAFPWYEVRIANHMDNFITATVTG